MVGQIWDTAGLEKSDSMVNIFYRGTDGCMLICDVTSRKSVDSLETWRDKFRGGLQKFSF
jgi:GTPase SAR1 family protein